MPAKLTDAQVVEIRELGAQGVERAEIATRYGISAQHVGRLLRGSSRSSIESLDARHVADGNVTRALERFVAGLELDAGRRVLAEAALALAAKLDECRATSSGAAAQAAPGVARQLVEVVALLRDGEPVPVNPLAEIRRRRDAHLLATEGGDWKTMI